jgi:hypothetical protein
VEAFSYTRPLFAEVFPLVNNGWPACKQTETFRTGLSSLPALVSIDPSRVGSRKHKGLGEIAGGAVAMAAGGI